MQSNHQPAILGQLVGADARTTFWGLPLLAMCLILSIAFAISADFLAFLRVMLMGLLSTVRAWFYQRPSKPSILAFPARIPVAK
jgi:1,4-dihydroxy-2-naphthoate octaprenyltransferase